MRQNSGKRVHAWAIEAPGLDPSTFVSHCSRWSGRPAPGLQLFPEIDRAEWTPIPVATERLVAGQRPLLDALIAAL